VRRCLAARHIAYPPVDQTPVPVNRSKTGHMTVQMVKTAAWNIAATIKGGERISQGRSSRNTRQTG
jgi:hypothetical protein